MARNLRLVENFVQSPLGLLSERRVAVRDELSAGCPRWSATGFDKADDRCSANLQSEAPEKPDQHWDGALALQLAQGIGDRLLDSRARVVERCREYALVVSFSSRPSARAASKRTPASTFLEGAAKDLAFRHHLELGKRCNRTSTGPGSGARELFAPPRQHLLRPAGPSHQPHSDQPHTGVLHCQYLFEVPRRAAGMPGSRIPWRQGPAAGVWSALAVRTNRIEIQSDPRTNGLLVLKFPVSSSALRW